MKYNKNINNNKYKNEHFYKIDENDKAHLKKISTDNLLRKIQIHYLSFIISFINDILKYLNYNQRFFKLDYRLKKNVYHNFFLTLSVTCIFFIS